MTIEEGKPDWSVELFLNDLETIQNTKGEEDALDLMFTCLDFFLCNHQFEEVQKIVDAIDVTRYTDSTLLGFCVQFWNAQRDGIIYEPFRQRCEAEILRKRPGYDVDKIFYGLKGIPEGPTIGDMLRSIGQGNQHLY